MEKIHKHYWPWLYGGTYISSGVLAFFLPTQTLPEVVFRLLFIGLGIALLVTKSNPTIVKLLIGGITLLTLWGFIAIALIVTNLDNSVYKIHLFWLPYMNFFAVKHYKAIRELSE